MSFRASSVSTLWRQAAQRSALLGTSPATSRLNLFNININRSVLSSSSVGTSSFLPVSSCGSTVSSVAWPATGRAFASSSSALAHSNGPFADHNVLRHNGPDDAEIALMLKEINIDSLDTLVNKTVPLSIRSKEALLPNLLGKSETDMLDEFKEMMSKNEVFRSHIGTGYYNTYTPLVILRNILENPAWYTQYTPYQAEISQGRLEMLLNFQTMVTDITGLHLANASLLDEATAAAEAMFLLWNNNKDKRTCLVDGNMHPQSIDLLRTRAKGFKINVQVCHNVAEMEKAVETDPQVFALMLQYPGSDGKIEDFEPLVKKATGLGIKTGVASDLLALTMLKPPGEWGAHVCFGSAQRFGVPMGYGGPHAAFFACTADVQRRIPGRVIGVSKDSRNKRALRMAMQTREQHIRREKATSNICTAQALLSNIAAAYGCWHGPEGLTAIATKAHAHAKVLAAYVIQNEVLKNAGFSVRHKNFFDTVTIDLNGKITTKQIVQMCEKKKINVRPLSPTAVSVSFDETSKIEHVADLIDAFVHAVFLLPPTAGAFETCLKELVDLSASLNYKVPVLARTSPFMTHAIFHKYRSETEMLRYLMYLQSKDYSLAHGMIPLGSCTMKLNSTSEMIPVTWPEVGQLHPFAPFNQTQGYQKMFAELRDWLCAVTGFDACSIQPNSGAQGEYAGLLAIKRYHESRGDFHRDVCLIPTSAHGTNPASANMVGMSIIVVKSNEKGEVDMADLKEKAVKHKDKLACLMVTYPSTHGVFEDTIIEVCDIIHANGGQVYMDGANMNAQVGLTAPGFIGADVCHLNLHKTFCIPHGGGGPGMGPICVRKQLAPFLSSHVIADETDVATGKVFERDTAQSYYAVSGAPFGSSSILPISWAYIRMLGGAGLTHATKVAILTANYIRVRLAGHYPILFTSETGMCAHEFIIDIRPIKAKTGITEEDIAKRLMDFNFHAPTMSFPVAGTLMIEPTESESKFECDRLITALIKIREEVKEVEDGKADPLDNVLKGAPHTADTVLSDSWNRKYSREKAAYPVPSLRLNKFWPTVGRLDNVYGDRNLICSCPPMEEYDN